MGNDRVRWSAPWPCLAVILIEGLPGTGIERAVIKDDGDVVHRVCPSIPACDLKTREDVPKAALGEV